MASNHDQPLFDRAHLSGHQSLQPAQQQQIVQGQVSLSSNGNNFGLSNGAKLLSSSPLYQAPGAEPYAEALLGPAQSQVNSTNSLLYRSQPNENQGIGPPHPRPEEAPYQADIHSQYSSGLNGDQAGYPQHNSLQNSKIPPAQDLVAGTMASISPPLLSVMPSGPVLPSIQTNPPRGRPPNASQRNTHPPSKRQRTSTKNATVLPKPLQESSPPVTNSTPTTQTREPYFALDNTSTNTSQPHPSVRELTHLDAFFGQAQIDSSNLDSLSPPPPHQQPQQPGFVQTGRNPFRNPASSSPPPSTDSLAQPKPNGWS